MKIALIVEGKTEKAFLPHLKSLLSAHLAKDKKKLPRLDAVPYDGRIPTGEKLKRVVEKLLTGSRAADYVIALTDVYTGSHPPDFKTAADAMHKMRQWTKNNPKFSPHAAQYDFEAWLLPYWATIQRLAGHNQAAPTGNPENVNHNNPPAHRIKKIFEAGHCRDSYIKPRDAGRILRENDLMLAVNSCSQLKLLVNKIITLCKGTPLP